MYDVMLIVSVLIFAAVTTYYVKQPAASVFHPATYYLLFHGLVFVVRPLFARLYDFRSIYRAMAFTPSLDDKITVLVCTNIALIVFVYTVLRVGNAPLRFQQDSADHDARRQLRLPFWITALILGPISLWSTIWYIRLKASGLDVATIDPRTGGSAVDATSGYFLQVQQFLPVLAVLLAWLYRFRPWTIVVFVAFVVIRAATGGRGDFVYAMILLVLLYMYDNRARWLSARAFAGLAAVGLLFSYVVHDRGQAIREIAVNDVGARHTYGEDLAPLESMDFGNLEFFEFLVYAVPGRTGSYDYFANVLQVFTEPIPRAIWKDKPFGQPVRYFYLYDYGRFIGMTYSVPGAGWYSLGYLGVVIWTGFIAAIYGFAYRAITRRDHTNLSIAAYCVMLATCILSYRDGILLTILKQLVFCIIPVLMIGGVARLLGVSSAHDLRWLNGLRRRRASAGSRQGTGMGALESGALEPMLDGPRAWRARDDAGGALTPRAWRERR